MTAVGELITPTAQLVLPPEQLNGEAWLQARRWRAATDQFPAADLDAMGKVLAERYGYRIGSSDVPSILDLPGSGTPAEVFRAKAYDIRVEPNEAMEWGHRNEPAIAEAWCERNHAVIDEIGLVANVDRPWRQSTIDRRVRECPVDRDGECLLEVKNVDAHVAKRWHKEIPDRIFAQIIDQLDVTGYRHAHWACLVGGNRLKSGIIYADRERKVMTFVRERVEAYRVEHLLAGVEPEWSTTDKPDKMIQMDEATHPDRVGELDIDGIGDVMAYAEAARRKADAEKERKRCAARLRQLADGHEYVKFADEPAYRLGPTTRTNVNLDRLAELYPEAYNDPRVVTETKGHTIYLDKAYKVTGDE